MFSPIEVIAPAKVNLALHIVGQRADGRHSLESLVAFTRIGDRIRFEPAARDSFELTGPFAAGLRDETANLVLAARDRLRAQFPASACDPVRICLEKNLPIAAGVGGGSSDGAATMKALARYWRLDVDPDGLCAMALALGADLPMCIAARPLVASGIGERLRPVGHLPALHLVLVNPGVPVATGAVFAALARKCNPALPDDPLSGSLSAWIDWLSFTRNDLETPARAIAPPIAHALDALRQSGAAVARMSGSGATCYGLFENEEAQRRAADRIRQAGSGWFVMAAATHASPQAGEGKSG